MNFLHYDQTLESSTFHLAESKYTTEEQNNIVNVKPKVTSNENQLVHEPAVGPSYTLSFDPKVEKQLTKIKLGLNGRIK